MKVLRMFVLLTIMLTLLSACGNNKAGTSTQDPQIPDFTTETGWVIDTTGKLSAQTEAQLEAMLSTLNGMGRQTVIAVFNNCNSCNQVLYATKVINDNGIGDEQLDNGVAIVVFLEIEGWDDHKPAVAMAVGSGLEGEMNDAKVGRLLDNTFVPQRAKGNWEQGLIDLVAGYTSLAQGQISDYPEVPHKGGLSQGDILLIIIVIVVLIILAGCDIAFNGGNGIILVASFAASSTSLGGGGSGRGGGASR